MTVEKKRKKRPRKRRKRMKKKSIKLTKSLQTKDLRWRMASLFSPIKTLMK